MGEWSQSGWEAHEKIMKESHERDMEVFGVILGIAIFLIVVLVKFLIFSAKTIYKIAKFIFKKVNENKK